MKFDTKHPAIKIALDSAKDARGDLSEQTRFGAIRTFGDMLSEAVGEFGERPRRIGKLGDEKQQSYLNALLKLGLLSDSEYDDLDIVRKIGNKGAHGQKIYPNSRIKALNAFDRLVQIVEAALFPKLTPSFLRDHEKVDAADVQNSEQKLTEQKISPIFIDSRIDWIVDPDGTVESPWKKFAPKFLEKFDE